MEGSSKTSAYSSHAKNTPKLFCSTCSRSYTNVYFPVFLTFASAHIIWFPIDFRTYRTAQRSPQQPFLAFSLKYASLLAIMLMDDLTSSARTPECSKQVTSKCWRPSRFLFDDWTNQVGYICKRAKKHPDRLRKLQHMVRISEFYRANTKRNLPSHCPRQATGQKI